MNLMNNTINNITLQYLSKNVNHLHTYAHSSLQYGFAIEFFNITFRCSFLSTFLVRTGNEFHAFLALNIGSVASISIIPLMTPD